MMYLRTCVVLSLTMFLSGCLDLAYDGNGKVSYQWDDKAILKIGLGAKEQTFLGSLTTQAITGAKGQSTYRYIQTLDVTNGSVECTTTSERWGGRQNDSFHKATYQTQLTCSDRTSGQVVISNDYNYEGFANSGMQGTGVGKMIDGQKIKLLFGKAVNDMPMGF